MRPRRLAITVWTLLALLAAPSVALAGQSDDEARQADGDTFLKAVAGVSEGDAHAPLAVTRDALADEYPAVARAVDTPDEFVLVHEDELENVRAFWSRMSDHDALRVDGALFEIQLAMFGEATGDGSSTAKAVDEDVPADDDSYRAQSAGLQAVPLVGGVAAAVLVGVGALAAVLVVRRR